MDARRELFDTFLISNTERGSRMDAKGSESVNFLNRYITATYVVI